ncbi:DUF6044 family protein [Thermaerobacillus caldiproteolyticus]|uniref:YkoS n=1 Tax=Thermaerobacillus caldiproteolyticus TaxID=247480 RepID=A0A7V9Z818_9BACL|nr:DUF6044 family protein [Anoxybacillus caldiproteolyticus]MBA2875763.1 hypothetical protein [Anoxybacillus caldiproteolyticus]QPA30662.1 hypothetical protein ISX45_13925 [Anoxybacillus caldiproteolyticus]
MIPCNKQVKNKEQIAIWIAVLLLALYLSPLYLLGENAHIRVHDNLDSNIAWYKVLTKSGELFGPLNATIPQVINGLPRNAFGTEFSGIVWLHALFPSMVAYALSQTITRVFAFLGMYLLLKRHFLTEQEAYLIRVGAALAFALTPFWPSGMLSTLGMPLALWAFLTIRNRQASWKEWLVLALLPFYASFVLGFFFFLTAMALLWLRDVIVKKQWNLPFLGSIAFMTGLFLAIEYRLVYSLLFGEEPTSRNEFVSSKLGFWHTVRLVFKNYLLGHTHVMTLHTFIILPVLFIAFAFVIAKQNKKIEKQFLFLFVLNFVLSVWYAFWFYKGWQPLKERFSLLNTFNFARFHFLRPLVIYLDFAIALWILWQRGEKWRRFVVVSLVLQILLLCGFNEEIRYRIIGTPSFKEFYAEHLFQEIKDYIGQPQSSYRVASIGLHPAIAQYNGFYTLDTYNNFYPLSYKHEFRKIIAKELDKSPELKDYFDHWGNRVYIFSAELGKHYDFRKTSHKKIRHLDINTDVFKKMGGRYIFSSVPIMNAKENHLRLMKSFEDSESVWKIYLYKVE